MSFRIKKWGLPLSKKFEFNDNWSTPEIYAEGSDIDVLVKDHIGYGNGKLDNTKYEWGAVKLPKGKTWNKDSILHKTDKEYEFSQVRFYDAGKDLYVQFKCGTGYGLEIMPIEGLSTRLQRHIREYLSKWSQFNRQSQIVIRYKQPAIYFTLKNYKERTYYEICSDLRDPNCRDIYVFGRHFDSGLLEIMTKVQIWKRRGKPKEAFRYDA